MTAKDSAPSSTRYQKHCPGCFQLKDGVAVCPHCGYDEATPRSPLFLPHGMILGGQYRVGRVLGRPGGFGITYLGWDINLQQRVAIKEYLPRELAARTQEALDVSAHTPDDRRGFEFGKEQFLREARIVAKLDHPNIVRVRNFFNAHSTAYLVMDYYEGMSLGDYLTTVRTSLEPELAIPLVKPILDGLQYVHERGLVHRDLKPHNVYLAAIGRPIVLDFGAARQAAGDRVQSLSVVLTEGYAPLEQYQRRAIQGPWTDVYGVAATLYRMITGAAPAIALDRIGHDPVENGWNAIPPGLVPAMRKALAVRPNERYQSAAEFREALEEYRSSAAGTARPEAAPPLRPRGDPPSGSPTGALSRPRSASPLPPMTPLRGAVPITAPAEPISSRVPRQPSPPPAVLRAGPADPDSRRPASGYPLLGRPSPLATPDRPLPIADLDSAPVSAAPLHRRLSDPVPAASLTPQPAPTPQRRGSDRPASAISSRLLLVALALTALAAMLYVLMNPPGSGSPPPVPVTPVARPAVELLPAAPVSPVAGEAAAPDTLPPVQAPPLLALPAGPLPAFRIGVSEVTVGQFGEFVRRSGYRNPRWQNYPCESAGGRLPEWDSPGYEQGDDHPVVCVSWADANAYAQWLSRETGLGYRLPTEAEWEYAARAGAGSRYWWGDDYDPAKASCQGCPPKLPSQPSSALSFPANPFGLHEVLGNVREWTCSSYLASELNSRCSVTGEDLRVAVRGGSWRQGVEALDLGRREAFEPYRRNTWTGFRLAQDLPRT